MEHARVGNRLSDVLETADPADNSLDPHSEPTVGDASIPAKVEIPLEGLAGQVVSRDPLGQQLVVVEGAGRHR